MGLKNIVARDNVLRITKNKSYNIKGKTVDLADELSRKNKKSLEYRADDISKIDITNKLKRDTMCKIKVMPCDSLDACKKEGTAVLNFASSKHPGGGFMTGAMAQEESICYRSNLYKDLVKHTEFYSYNQNNLCKSLYSDGVIYSEKILIFKNNKLENIEPYYNNIITCAAPNANSAKRHGVTEKEIYDTMYRRVEQVIKVAIDNDTKVLVLGAFGCGVFGNEPEAVAEIMYDLIVNKEYGLYFDSVLFAMHDSTSKNARAFIQRFKQVK